MSIYSNINYKCVFIRYYFFRVVMRREQVLKICLNHILTNEINYKQKDSKTWLFSAPDYSEGEIQHKQFCIRFKNGEVAKNFKKVIDDALSGSGK